VDTGKRITDIAIRLALIFLLVAWCFRIVRPFITPVIWAAIIAVSIYPVYGKLLVAVGHRKKLSAALLVIVGLAAIFIPAYFLFDSLIESAVDLSQNVMSGELKFPAPPAEVSDWPVIGKSLYNIWHLAATNLDALFAQYDEQLRSLLRWFGDAIIGTGAGILHLVLSVIIAGVFLVTAQPIKEGMSRLFLKLAGQSGLEMMNVATRTVTNVTKGILGVAIIQGILIGACLLLSHVPYAGLWALIATFLGVIQIGSLPVTIGVVIFYFSTKEPLPATVWTIVLILISLSDNVLKPLLLGRGAPVPTLVIFLGAIGGFIASGFVGLFTGAIVLSIGYRLLLVWIDAPVEA